MSELLTEIAVSNFMWPSSGKKVDSYLGKEFFDCLNVTYLKGKEESEEF